MLPKPIPFGEWLPDRPEIGNNGATVAKNVIPSEGAYRPLPGLSATTTAVLGARCQGAKAFFDTDRNVVVYAGDATKLYRRTADTFTDRSGATYFCPTDACWRFVQFGTTVVALQMGADPQYVSLDESVADFADLPGSPPRAVTGARVRDFLVLGNLVSKPHRIQWSGFNNIETWGSDAATQADFQDLPNEYGAVTAIIGPDYGTVFQEFGVSRMSYVGPPATWRIDTLETGRGCIAPHGFVQTGQYQAFFPAHDGIYAWDGSAAVPIGDGKINRWFAANMSWQRRAGIVGAYDPVNRLVVWGFPDAVDNTLSKYLIFSLKDGRFSSGELESEYIFGPPDRGNTLEEMDSEGTLETIPYSLDSQVWQGGQVRLGAFNTSHQLATFTGSNLEAVVETGEFEPAPGTRGYVSELWPVVDNTSGTVTAQIGTRAQKAGDTLTFVSASSQNAAGFCPVRADGRYFRARVTVPAGAAWTHAQGVQVTAKASGRR